MLDKIFDLAINNNRSNLIIIVEGDMRLLKYNNLGPILVMPAMMFIFFIIILPVFYTFYCSMFDLKYIVFNKFLGLRNYLDILNDPIIIRSIYYTLSISIISVIVSLLSAMFLALWIDSRKGIFSYSLQVVGLMPWVTSMVVAGLLWRWIFDADLGLLNHFFSTIGVNKINFLGDRYNASIALMFVMSWRIIGYAMVMILAGLKSIPQHIEEAAEIDGASPFDLLWRVKIPMIKTQLLLSLIVLTLSNFNNVTVPMTLTGGGPADATNVITLEAYRQGFVFYNFGMASALAFVIFIINIVLVRLYVKMVKYNV